jgi:hypothetical protein
MGKAARQFVLAAHDWNAMLSPLESLVSAQGEGTKNAA